MFEHLQWRLRWRSLCSYLNPFCDMQQIPVVALECFQSICRLKDLCNSVSHRGQCPLLGTSGILSPWARWGSGSPAAAQRCWRSAGSSARLGLASPPQLMRLSVSRSVCKIVFAGHRILQVSSKWQHVREYLRGFLCLPFFFLSMLQGIFRKSYYKNTWKKKMKFWFPWLVWSRYNYCLINLLVSVSALSPLSFFFLLFVHCCCVILQLFC